MANAGGHTQLSDDHLQLFQQTRDQLLSQLSEDGKLAFAQCHSPDVIIQELKGHQDRVKDHKKWVKILESVEKVNKSLSPFFSVFNLVASSHPEYAAVVWGAFRFVLKLASNFTSFFERLDELLFQLSVELPQYDELLRICRAGTQIPERLSHLICNLYLDLLKFFVQVTHIFTRRDGRLRKAPVVMGKLMFRPFDHYFDNLVRRLSIHKETLHTEIEIINLKQIPMTGQVQQKVDLVLQSVLHLHKQYEQEKASDHLASNNPSHDLTDKSFQASKLWINAPDFMDDYKLAISQKKSGTCEWLKQNPTFLGWQHLDPSTKTLLASSSTLWIWGNPGCGKSTLASSVIEDFRNGQQALHMNTSIFLCYFFFRYEFKGKNSIDDALRALLAQLVHHQRSENICLDALAFFRESQAPGQSYAYREDLVELIRALIQPLNSLVLVLDGIDECLQPEELMSVLESTFSGFFVKIIIFSRPHIQYLRTRLGDIEDIEISRTVIQADLELYIRGELDELLRLKLLDESVQSTILVQKLLIGADGMFLWARLMMSYLKSPELTRKIRLNIIQRTETPEELSEMYFRICSLISNRNRRSRDLARRVLTILIYGLESLSTRELCDAVYSVPDSTSDTTFATNDSVLENQAELESSIILLSAGIIELHHGKNQEKEFRLIHHSAYEFFKDRSASKKGTPSAALPVLMTAEEGHADLVSLCISYIIHNVPSRPLSGDLFLSAKVEDIKASMPFLCYASISWLQHLCHLRLQRFRQFKGCLERTEHSIKHLLESKLKLMVWVEALYTLSRGLDWHSRLYEEVLSWTSGSSRSKKPPAVFTEVAALMRDLSELHRQWGRALKRSPQQLWEDVTAFIPSRFFVNTSAVTMQQLKNESLPHSRLSSNPLCRISSVSPHGAQLAMLEIWTSREFELQSLALGTGTISPTAWSHWVARYTMWDTTTDPASRIDEFEFALDKYEIEMQAQGFSFRSDKSRNFELPFPININRQLNVFTVLRTIFYRNKDATVPETWQRVTLPINQSIINEHTGQKIYWQTSTDSNSMAEPLQVEGVRSYRLLTTNDGKHVLYTARTCSQGKFWRDSANILKAFSFISLDDVMVLRNIASLYAPEFILTRYCFHPRLPLLLFAAYGNGGRPVLWHFTSSTINLMESMRTGEPLSLSLIESSQPERPAAFAKHEMLCLLQFSTCGTQVVFQSEFDQYLTVASIKDQSAYILADSEFESLKNPMQGHQQLVSRPQSVTTVSSSPSQTFDTNSLVRIGSSSQQAIRVSMDSCSGNSSIGVATRQSNREEFQSIITLPAKSGLERLDPTIINPSGKDEWLTIFLNQLPQWTYSFGREDEEVHPTVIRKNKAMLSPLRRKADTIEASPEDDASSSSVHPPSKRLKGPSGEFS